MGQALYRKYRSKSLGEIVGQEHITKALEGSLKSGRISHAYLFTGPRGTGKTSIARILAHEINSLPYTDDSQHLDIIEIDAASNRRIDDIRDLRDKVHIAPVSAKYKVYIIDEVHMLTGESFNALLKTLEEPPEHVVFILATTEVHKLPATIISRTQRYSFRAAEKTQLVAHLKQMAKKEKITISDEALGLIAEHGNESFRDSVGLLDQMANVSGGTISVETIENTLGLAPKDGIAQLLKLIQAGDHRPIIAKLAELESNGTSTAVLINQLLSELRQQATDNPKLFLLIDRILDVPKSHNPQLKLLTTLLDFAMDLKPVAEKKHAATHSTPPKPVLEISAAPSQIRKQSSEPLPVIEELPAQAKEKSVTPTAAISAISDKQWGQVLNHARKENPPLFAIIRMAQQNFDADKQLLTLGFRFGLHSKKLDDAKHKTKLSRMIAEVLGSCPEIITEVNKNAEAPQIADAPAPEATAPIEVDEQTKSVLDMMGGGDLLNAEAAR